MTITASATLLHLDRRAAAAFADKHGLAACVTTQAREVADLNGMRDAAPYAVAAMDRDGTPRVVAAFPDRKAAVLYVLQYDGDRGRTLRAFDPTGHRVTIDKQQPWGWMHFDKGFKAWGVNVRGRFMGFVATETEARATLALYGVTA